MILKNIILEASVPSPDCTTYSDSIENVQTTGSTSRTFFLWILAE